MELLSRRDDASGSFGVVRVSGRPRVLVVDDMPMVLMTAKNMLSQLYDVGTVKSGAEALEYLAHNFVDIALLDISMPGMSGVELFEKIIESPDYRSIPVIFVTSERSHTTIETVIGKGAKDFILKPFDERTLLSKVHRALRGVSEDQAILFLKRKMRVVIDCCARGNIGLAETTMKEIPTNVYSMSVILTFNRILSSLHNRNFNEALGIAEDTLKRL